MCLQIIKLKELVLKLCLGPRWCTGLNSYTIAIHAAIPAGILNRSHNMMQIKPSTVLAN